MSLSASVVTAGAAQVHGDAALAEGLTNLGELLGVPVDTPWTKRYAFGLLPIGDAFVAWSKTAPPWVADSPSPPPPSPCRGGGGCRCPCCWPWSRPSPGSRGGAPLRGRREAQAGDAVSLPAPEPRAG
ncbi:hypothetical protein [Streptomyces wuyuanensis]|uniref:hypothetical protein n=1 Tax=Streptomyces wuyuanensis TaxID=1196353 RepID=UPI00379A9C63